MVGQQGAEKAQLYYLQLYNTWMSQDIVRLYSDGLLET